MHKDNYFNKFKNDKEYQSLLKEEKELLEIAIQVIAARKKKKMTQAELAKRVRMPQSQIARIEGGNHNITIKSLNKVVGALDLKVMVG